MGKFIVIGAPSFDEACKRLTVSENERISGFLDQLSEHGDKVGKPLGYLFFREKKFNGNRLYFLVYSEWSAILVVTISDKKEQPQTISQIKNDIPYYREWIRKRLMKEGLI